MGGVADHSLEEDPAERERFLACANAEIERLKQAKEPADSKAAVEAFLELIAQHNRAVQQEHRSHTTELSQSLRMMADTIAFVGRSSQVAVHQLSVIEHDIEEATATEDAAKLRVKLGGCLQAIREQGERLRTQSEDHLQQLKAFVASTAAGKELALLDEPLDAVTGLPGRGFAENLIQEKLSQRLDSIVAVVRIDRLQAFMNRYGQAAVDRVMERAAQLLALRAPEGSILCRWSANSFIAFTEITTDFAGVSRQWNMLGSLKFEENIEEGGRAAFVVLTTSMLLEHLRATASRRNLIQNLDRFVGVQTNAAVPKI